MEQDVEVALRLTEAIMSQTEVEATGLENLAQTYVALFSQVHVRVKEYLNPSDSLSRRARA